AFLLFLACLYRDREKIRFDKTTLVCTVVIILATAGIAASFIIPSMDDFRALLNTSYPGHRIATGGKWKIYDLFTHLYSVFLPYKDTNTSNNSEIATFIHFTPLFFLLLPRVLWKSKKSRNNLIGIILFVSIAVLSVFMVIGFPEWLAKITLFSYLNRTKVVHGWLCVLYMIWFFDIAEREKISFSVIEKIAYPVLFALSYLFFVKQKAISYLTYKYLVAELLVFAVLLLLWFFEKRKIFTVLMIALMVFAGATVNPVRRGLSPITNHPISNLIRKSAEEDPEARWIVVNDMWPISNFVMANGAKVVSGTNFYPVGDYDLIDQTGEYYDAYNRYSNETIELIDGEMSMDVPHTDNVVISLNPDDLKTLGVRYVISGNDVSGILQKYDVAYEVLMEQDGHTVYHLSY
ncbi:MAG: hypothetical protein IIZ47_00550, partial [Erysipelotrichaceae bacterium]|nr:hypothetical protein [Erysipelotrichaceae bacterium]